MSVTATGRARARARAAAADAARPPVRGEVRGALQRDQDPRVHAPVHRRGGGRGRGDAGARRRTTRSSRPTASTGTRSCAASRPARSWPRCTARSKGARAGGAARCTCSMPRRGSTAATRSSAAACRWRSGWRSRTSSRAAARVTACFFGDGAVAEGEFHESHEPGGAVEPAGAVPAARTTATRWAPRSSATSRRPTSR